MLSRARMTNILLLLLLSVGCQAPKTEVSPDAPRVSPEPNPDPIPVHGDRRTEAHYVGEFIEQGSMPEAAFWKLELQMSEPDKERKLFEKR